MCRRDSLVPPRLARVPAVPAHAPRTSNHRAGPQLAMVSTASVQPHQKTRENDLPFSSVPSSSVSSRALASFLPPCLIPCFILFYVPLLCLPSQSFPFLILLSNQTRGGRASALSCIFSPSFLGLVWQIQTFSPILSSSRLFTKYAVDTWHSLQHPAQLDPGVHRHGDVR